LHQKAKRIRTNARGGTRYLEVGSAKERDQQNPWICKGKRKRKGEGRDLRKKKGGKGRSSPSARKHGREALQPMCTDTKSREEERFQKAEKVGEGRTLSPVGGKL